MMVVIYTGKYRFIKNVLNSHAFDVLIVDMSGSVIIILRLSLDVYFAFL